MLFISFSLNVQGQIMIWSGSSDIYNYSQFVDPVLNHEHQLFLVRSREPDLSRKLYIESYSDSLRLLNQTRIKSKIKEGTVVSYFCQRNEFWIFRSVYSLLDGYNFLYLEKYNFNSGNPFETKELCRSPLKSYGDKGDFLVTRSEDRTKYLCYFTTVDDNGSEIVNLYMLNNESRIIYAKSFPGLYQSADAELVQIECDGKARSLLLYTEPSVLPDISSEHLMYKLAVYDSAEDKVYISVLDSGSYDIPDLYMTVDGVRDKAVFGGFYNYKKRAGIEGSIYIKANLPNGRIYTVAYNHLDDSFRKKALGEKQFLTNPTIKDFVIRNQWMRSDGSSILLAERVYTSQQSYTISNYGAMQTSYRTVFNFNEIVVLATSADGSIIWQQAIKKNQVTVNDGGIYSGFAWSIFNDRILFHFNASNKSGKSIMEYALMNNGEVLEREFINTNDEEYMMIPSSCKQISANELFFILNKEGNQYLLKAKYPF